MITIIHGDDTANSRNFYVASKQKVPSPITLDGANVTSNDIAQALGGDSLFALVKHIFIEDLLSKRKPSKELENITKFIIANEESTEIYLWESKELTKKQLTPFKKAVVKQFKISTIIFQFLDNLKPNNSKLLLQLFHKTLVTDDEQFIFFLLVRHIRLLLALADSPKNLSDPGETRMTGNIDETKRLAPWQKSKLQKQARLFTIDILTTIYKKLFAIDLAQKTGNLAMPIVDTIDFLLTEI